MKPLFTLTLGILSMESKPSDERNTRFTFAFSLNSSEVHIQSVYPTNFNRFASIIVDSTTEVVFAG
jgi:hypothetical protein